MDKLLIESEMDAIESMWFAEREWGFDGTPDDTDALDYQGFDKPSEY